MCEREDGGTERCHNCPVSVAPPLPGLFGGFPALLPPSPNSALPPEATTLRSPAELRAQTAWSTKALAHSSSGATDQQQLARQGRQPANATEQR